MLTPAIPDRFLIMINIQTSSLKDEFDKFFNSMTQHTDLLVKIIAVKEIVLSPSEEREIQPKILLKEKKQIHEAFVLKICATWEILAESIFVECLPWNTSKYSASKGITLPTKLTPNTCKGLISGLGYFSFRNAKDIKDKAKRYLKDRWNPFKEIPSDLITKINEFYIIRNYIAHRSDAARQSLVKMYKKTYGMRFRPPGNFLFETVTFVESGERGKEIRFANYSEAFVKAADEMAFYLGIR